MLGGDEADRTLGTLLQTPTHPDNDTGTNEVVLPDNEVDLPPHEKADQGEDGRLELLLEKARLEREKISQEEAHKRQLADLRTEMLMNQTWIQGVLQELK